MQPRLTVPGAVAVLCAVVLAAAAVAADGANVTESSPRASLGFLDCLSSVRGRTSRAALLNADDEDRDDFLGRVVGCAKVPVVRGLRAVRGGGDVKLLDGAVVLHRVPGTELPRPSNRDVDMARALDENDDLATYHDLIVEVDKVSRAFAMDVEVYPGVRATLGRDARSEDAVNLSFKLDGLTGLADDDADDVQGRDIEDGDFEVEDRHDHKKKKVLKGLKKLKKKLAPYLPLLAIPLAIQLMMLPLYIMALKMMALKSILLGKMTLMLVAFNILRNVQQRQMEDSHNSRVAEEYYGYHDDGVEYGGWVNGRSMAASSRSGSRSSRVASSKASVASSAAAPADAQATAAATAYRGWSGSDRQRR